MTVAAAHLTQALRTMLRGVVRADEPLHEHTSLRIGGPSVMVFPADAEDIARVLRWAHERGVAVYPLGAGTNVLAPDEGLRGVVLRSKPALDYVRVEGSRLIAGAGASVARVVAQAAQQGLRGAEVLAGVPGSMGGALVMNAGTRAGEIGPRVAWVRVLDERGEERRLTPAELQYGYRTSALQRQPWFVLEGMLDLEPGDPAEVRAELDRLLQYRNRTQPLVLPNAGSIFKNPPGDAAGRLIDAAGCKGWREGGASVSTLHANWIVNEGQATARDVLRLMARVWRAVRDRFGVALEPEIRLLGDLERQWEELKASS